MQGHCIRNGMRCCRRRGGARGPHIRSASKFWLAWVPALSRLLASLPSGAGMTKVECTAPRHARRQLRVHLAVGTQNSSSKQRKRIRSGQNVGSAGRLCLADDYRQGCDERAWPLALPGGQEGCVGHNGRETPCLRRLRVAVACSLWLGSAPTRRPLPACLCRFTGRPPRAFAVGPVPSAP
jgi:hypothetical protein